MLHSCLLIDTPCPGVGNCATFGTSLFDEFKRLSAGGEPVSKPKPSPALKKKNGGSKKKPGAPLVLRHLSSLADCCRVY
jgi:hypothetical protein